MTAILVACAAVLAVALGARRTGHRLRLSQARYRIGRLGGTPESPIALPPGIPRTLGPAIVRRPLPPGWRFDEQDMCYVDGDGRRTTALVAWTNGTPWESEP